MRKFFSVVIGNLRRRRHIDAYAVTVLAFSFAIISLVSDVLVEDVRWSVALAGIGLLVYRLTFSDASPGTVDIFLKDRSAFAENPFPARLSGAREVWIFAPSAVNILVPAHCDVLHETVLSHPDGVVRVVVLDPADEAAVQLAIRHLDHALDGPLQLFRTSLEATMAQLRRMARWEVEGTFEHRLIDYNPGFSMVAIDPRSENGVIIVEMHGFYHEVTTSRMHMEIRREDSRRWYAHWIDQFDHIWQEALRPENRNEGEDEFR